jgi:hypothetical protein
MNNETPNTRIETPKQTRKSKRIVIGLFVALAALIVFGVVASRAGLDKALLRQQLDALASQMHENAKAKGRDVTFTYGEIDVVGGFTDRHAVIHDPRIHILPDAITVTSPVLEIHPRSADLSSMTILLPQPVSLLETKDDTERNILTITGSAPLAMDYSENTAHNIGYSEYSFNAPSQLKLTYLREQRGEGPEEATPTITPVYENLIVTYDKASMRANVQRDNSEMGQSSLEIKNLRAVSQENPAEGALTIDQLVSEWSNQRNEGNQNVVNSSFALDNLQAPETMLPYAPISIAMDMSYTGTIPGSPQETAVLQPQENAFKLKTFSVKTKQANLNVTADFVASAEDQLPVGMANISLTNLPFVIAELKKYKMLSADNEHLISALLKQITGTDYAELKDVTIDVNRIRGGSFEIGKTTFEELFAMILQGGFIKMGTHTAPQLPDEQKPVEPLHLPEETRG